MHLTEIYGNGCNRLIRLLRVEAAEGEGFEAYIKEQIGEAIMEVNKDIVDMKDNHYQV